MKKMLNISGYSDNWFPKLLLKIKLTIFILFVSVASFAANTYTQQVKFTMVYEMVFVRTVLDHIEQNSEFIFHYGEKSVDINREVNIAVKDENVEYILDQLFKGTNNYYEISDRQIAILVKTTEDVEKDLFEKEYQQQDKKISGKVTDNRGAPLPGVSIIILGSTKGVVTGVDGKFEMYGIEPSTKLVFSFIGMESQIIEVGNQSSINVQMKDKVSELEDVTVVAFGKQKKESVISSISTIKPTELKVPSSNLTTSMAGRLAGVISYQTTGEPGQDNAEFFIRGVTTFGYKKNPLILIDGIELTTEDLARLQTDDIASFSILKDAAATSLYGARGANGVILVSTMEGMEGKAKIRIRFENSYSSATRKLEFADPITYMQLHNEAVKTRNPNGAVPYSYQQITRTKDPNRNQYVYPTVDWQDLLFKKVAPSKRFNLNVSGGGKVARYYIAGSYNSDKGNLKNDKFNNFDNNIDLDKFLLRSNVNIDVTPSTEIAVRFHGTFDNYRGPIDGGSGLYNKAVQANPVLFPAFFEKDEQHQYTDHILFGNGGTSGNFINPYADMVSGYKDNTRSLMLAQFEVEQELDFITEGLKFRFLGNVNRTSNYSTSRSYKPFYYNVAPGSYVISDNTFRLRQLNPLGGTEALDFSESQKDISSVTYLESSLMYDKNINEKHDVSAMLVSILRESKVANAKTLLSSLPARNLGVSGRLTYSYDSRYFVEANFGYNGSEKFSKTERFGFFPSAGLGWVISNENFWGQLKDKITKFKLRATYGLAGNDAIGDAADRFFYLSNVNLNDGNYGYVFGENFGYSRNGVSISRYANDQITWEISKKMNLGIEMSLYDVFNVQAEYFTDYRTKILLERADIPLSMGFQAAQKGNIGEASSKGFELSVDVNKSFNRDFWITARANFTYATSQFDEYEEPDFVVAGTPWRSRIGNSIGQTWGYVAERLFIDDQEAENSPRQFGEYGGGDIKYKDIDKDGRITENDLVPLGYPTIPEIVYGFGSSVGFKNFDFSFFFQGLANRSFWIDTKHTSPFLDTADGVRGNNALLKVYADNVWTEENSDPYSMFPRLSTDVIDNNHVTSSWFMRNGAFIRLKSLEVGYTVPQKLTERIGISSTRLYLSGTNLFTISAFKLWDVEMGSNGLAYPIQKVFNIGIQASF